MADYSIYIFPLVTGVIIAIVTQLVAHYFSKKNLETQRDYNKKDLETQRDYSMKLAKMQLYHEDRRQALVKLNELIKKTYKSYPEFRDAVNAFLDESSGLFLPDSLREELKKELRDIDAFLEDEEYSIYGPPPEYPEEEYDAWYESLDPFQKVDIDVEKRLSELKKKMKEKIKKNISEEEPM